MIRKLIIGNVVVILLFIMMNVLMLSLTERAAIRQMAVVVLGASLFGLMLANQPILQLFPRRDVGLVPFAVGILVFWAVLVALGVWMSDTWNDHFANQASDAIGAEGAPQHQH